MKVKTQWDATKIKKTDNIKSWWGHKSTEALIHPDCKMIQALWKTSWNFVVKLNIHLAYEPTISRVTEGVELTKVKCIHIWDILRNALEHWIWNLKWKEYKIGTVWGDTCGSGEREGGDEGEGIWLVGFIYIYEIKQWNFLQLNLCSCKNMNICRKFISNSWNWKWPKCSLNRYMNKQTSISLQYNIIY
jgi:hypothetical protein